MMMAVFDSIMANLFVWADRPRSPGTHEKISTLNVQKDRNWV